MGSIPLPTWPHVSNMPEIARTLSSRPHVNAEVDLPMMITQCRGSAARQERMHNVFDCLAFLANNDADYIKQGLFYPFETPEVLGRRECGTGKDQLCPGPKFLYHTYWKGPMTWRVELFIKSFLQTQNIYCSQLWLWVDSDSNPDAIINLLMSANFRQFFGLIASDTISLKIWRLPERVPLPAGLDHTDGRGFSRKAIGRLPNVTITGDRIFRDEDGQEWLDFYCQNKAALSPVTLSDIFRFVVLHLHGGVYLDMDMLLLRDIRPLLLSKRVFTARWGAHEGQGDINTAILSLSPNSSLSSYFLRIGLRLGLSYHPRILGDIARKDGRMKDLLVLETAVFDPVWTEFDGAREGKCTVPCFKAFEDFFMTKIEGEWESDGKFVISKGIVPALIFNRSMNNFFKGAFAYHVHNLVRMSPKSENNDNNTSSGQ